MFHRKRALNRVLKFIHQADDIQINEIIQALVRRYAQVYPDWDITFLSLPKNDPASCQQTLRSILKLYEHP